MEVEMKIRGLMMDPVTNMPIVVLKDPVGDAGPGEDGQQRELGNAVGGVFDRHPRRFSNRSEHYILEAEDHPGDDARRVQPG